MSITNPEFQSHRLNETGIKKVDQVKELFDDLLSELTNDIWAFHSPLLPEGRHLSIVKTKLEEACMFAVKAVSCDPANQLVEDSIQGEKVFGVAVDEFPEEHTVGDHLDAIDGKLTKLDEKLAALQNQIIKVEFLSKARCQLLSDDLKADKETKAKDLRELALLIPKRTKRSKSKRRGK
jgi:hypothetical protein